MTFYQCPDCGHRQKSKAEKRVQCHQCGRSYLKRKAQKFSSKTEGRDEEEEKKASFHNYSRKTD